MNKDEARQLLAKYIENDCTPEQRALVERWYLQEAAGQVLPDNGNDFKSEKAEIWAGTIEKAGISKKTYRPRTMWMASAAALLIFITAAVLFLNQKEPPQQSAAAVSKTADVIPGGNKAILTLGDGTSIVLDHAGNGTLARQGNIIIRKSADGQLVYDASAPDHNRVDASVSYNTISTPRGGEYQVILPDGSKVWLNSASSINFPTAFNGTERNVTITGEAYFEVASNPQKPFNVNANKTKVQVLGTHFNIMAYTNEHAVKTTLLEGSVKVSSGDESRLIKPGEQASVTGGNIRIGNANIDEAMAWRNGYFYFKNTDIETMMRQISRWYDVDVEYRGEIPTTVFTGKMYKNVNASKVLDILNYFKIDFTIEEPALPSGKKTIVIM